MIPTMRSLNAKFTNKYVNEVRSFPIGSFITNKMIVTLPEIVTILIMPDIIVVNNASGLGASVMEQDIFIFVSKENVVRINAVY